ETDVRCQRLKKVLNSGTVRVITTRDDIETLNERYIENKNIKTARVGDPVFWLPEMELVDKTDHRNPGSPTRSRIGINLINPNNFADYGGQMTRDGIINFYRNLIAELTRLNADFYLFS